MTMMMTTQHKNKERGTPQRRAISRRPKAASPGETVRRLHRQLRAGGEKALPKRIYSLVGMHHPLYSLAPVPRKRA